VGKRKPSRNEIQFGYLISQLSDLELIELKALALAKLSALARRRPRRVWLMTPDLFDRRQVNMLGGPRRRHTDYVWVE
jgi:hypothetical protein